MSEEAVQPDRPAFSTDDLEGKLEKQAVLVTGGSKGVGRGIVEGFLVAGADVLTCGRNEPGSALPSAAGRTAVFVRADVRDPEQAAGVVRETVERFGRIDVLVNNAGGAPYALAADASPRFFTSIVTLNLLAPFFCSQAANSKMQEQESGGCILNIGSVSGMRPSPGSAAYGAAKAGLVNLTETLAIEWAPKVRVNCVVGGMIETESSEDHYGGPEGLAIVAETIPMKRMGRPEDVAAACLFLASGSASYVSGASLEVHGGGESPAYLLALRNAAQGSMPEGR